MSPRRCAAGHAGMLLILAAVLGGCSSDREVLATVGDHVITVGDFVAAARGVQQAYPGPPDSAKVRLLDDLVRRELLLCGAEATIQPRDTSVRSYRSHTEAEMLARAVDSRMTATYTPVTDEEVRRFYSWRDSSTHLQIIYTYGLEAALGALAEVKRTGDFTAVAAHFNPSASLPANGDLGNQAPGDLLDPLDTIARTARPGSVVGPVEVPTRGWFLVKVLGRQPRRQPPFETQKAALAEMLRQRKQQQATLDHQLRLRQAYDVRLVPGGGQILFAHFNPPGGTPPRYSAQDLARPLAQWQEPGGTRTYTFGDALYDLETSNEQRPPGLLLPGIEQWILVMTLDRVVLTEARRERIADDPSFRRALDQSVNNTLLDGYYNAEVVQKSAQTPADLAEVYARESPRLARLQSATLDVVEFPDSAAAAAFTAHGAHARALRAAAAMIPGAPPVRAIDLSFPAADSDWARVQPALSAMRQGDALGPIGVSQGRWRIFQMLDKHMVIPPFDSLDVNTRNSLQQEAGDLGRERRLLQLVQDLRLTYRTRVYPERLRRVRWPVDAGGS